jgi:hypothetical protein
MGQMPKQQDLGSYLNPALKQYQADQAGYQQADEANRIDPQQVKPRLWERLAGFALGATQLKDPQNAGAVAGEVVNRRRAGAELQRSTALAPWTQRLQQDREGLPLAEASARTGYEQGELDLRRAGEGRERFSAITNAQAKEEVNSLREKWDDEKDKSNQERNAAYLEHVKDLENKYKDDDAVRQELFHLRERVQDFKETKAKEGKDHIAQTMGAETQKANALRAAEQAFNKAYSAEGFPADPKAEWSDEQHAKLAQFTQQRDEARQAAEDAYEAKSAELKGAPVDHQDVATWQKGSQTAAPVAAPSSAAPAGKPAATDALPKAPQGGAPLQDEAVAAQFLKAANGDPAKAVELAKAHGWTEK